MNNILKLGSVVRLTRPVYAGLVKDQAANLTKLPAGTVGTIRHVCTVADDEYYLVRFFY